MISVLFVCLGNICRSPMAEAVFRHYVKEAGLEDQIQIDSAGTYHGHIAEPPHYGTRNILRESNISYEGQRARLLVKEDITRFTYIIGMDKNNINNILSFSQGDATHIYSFVDFIPQSSYSEVPDPYYTGDFNETYKLISEGCKHLLEEIKSKHLNES